MAEFGKISRFKEASVSIELMSFSSSRVGDEYGIFGCDVVSHES
jgi:hypothetical protein